jgi:hypothetical protein
VSAKKIKKNKSQPKGFKKVSTLGTASEKTVRSRQKSPIPKEKRETVFVGSLEGNIVIFFVLAIATTVFYSDDLGLGFFSVDDPGYVTNNPWIKSISLENIWHILTTPYFANYSPIHLFSYMLDYAIAGPDAYAFHLSNNIWAGITAGFVYLTALAFTKNKIASIFASVLFIVHPVHVEAVAWISSRKDLVASSFALPSFLVFLKYRQVREHKKRWFLLSLFLFTFAVAGKLSVATFPAVFFLWDLFIEKRSFAKSLLDKVPFFIATLVVAILAASAQPSMGNKPDLFVISIALIHNFWLLTGFSNYVIYRMPPEPGTVFHQIAGLAFILTAFISPFLLHSSKPKVAILVYFCFYTDASSFIYPSGYRPLCFFPFCSSFDFFRVFFFMVDPKI